MESSRGTEGGPEDELLQIDLRRYVFLVRKWALAIVALVAVAVVGSVFYTRGLPRQFVATATVIVDPHAPAVLGRDTDEVVELGPDLAGRADYYVTQRRLLESKTLAEQTAVLGGFDRDARLIGDAAPGSETARARATLAVQRALVIQAPKEDRIFKVSAWSTVPELAAAIANQHVASYVAHQKGLRSVGTGEAGRWLGREREAAEQALADVEGKIYEFRRSNDMLAMTLEERKTLILADLERYNDALGRARIERIEVEKLRAQVERASGQPAATSPLFDMMPNETTRALKQQYLLAVAEREQLATVVGPKHTDYQAQQHRIAALAAALDGEAAATRAALETRYASIVEKERSFAAEIDRLKREAFELGPKEVEYTQLLRQRDAGQAQVARLTERLRTSELESRLEAVNVRPLDPAEVPGAPALPRLRDNVIKSVAAALFVALALLAVAGYLDRKLRTVEQLERTTKLTVLGALPSTRPLAGADPIWGVLRDQPQSPLAEASRGLRTNVLFALAGGEIRSLAVTSSVHFEGKTSTVLSLASTLAESGRRVLVVDTDMRRPRLATALGTNGHVGIADVMLGTASLEQAIKATDARGVDVLPCGSLPPNPCELLMTARFREVVAELENRYDLVVFDTPPALAVADAATLAGVVDGYVLVARAGRSLAPELNRIEQQLRRVGARLLGVVLNDVDLKAGGYYGYYGYHGVAPQAAPVKTHG